MQQEAYSTGVVIQFREEEERSAFHSAFQEWKKEEFSQGAEFFV